MLLKELIKTLRDEDFVEIGELQEDSFARMEGLTAKDLAKAFERFCQMLCELPVGPSDVVLIALPVTEDGETRTEAEYFEKQDFEAKISTILNKEMPAYTDTDSEDRYADILDETSNFLPISYAYEFTPWEIVLGATVFPENFEKVGRVPFVSSTLGEMSFNGMSREHQEERRSELDESIEEAKKISELPEEEQLKHLIQAEDLFSEFGVERDKDAWKEEIRLMMLDCVKTREAAIKEFKRIAELKNTSTI